MNYVLSSDFASLQRLIDSGFDRIGTGINQVNQGICNLGYSTLENFNTTNMGVATGFANLNNALCNQSFQIERGIAGIGTQLQGCCCDLRQQIADTSCGTLSAIKDVNYGIAMQTNALQNTLCNSTRDVIENQNANYRALHDEIVANRIEDKNSQIQAQQNQITALQLAASQAQQNQYLLNELKPCPIPAFLTCNPYTGNYGYTNVGISNGCGCGCGNY